MKRKTLIIVIVVLAVVGLIIGFFAGGYNSMVDKQNAVESKAADIQTQLQRRADLIPNFVETVKGYAAHEEKTYTAVTEARNAVKNATGVADAAAANDALNSAIDVWVNAVKEAYPELKANANFVALQDELAGTENRIGVARKDYNEAVKEYNATIRKFPKNILAGMFGFEKADYFEADSGSEKAPEVKF